MSIEAVQVVDGCGVYGSGILVTEWQAPTAGVLLPECIFDACAKAREKVGGRGFL